MAALNVISAMVRAADVMARCNELAAFTDEPGRLTRAYGTVALRQSQERVAHWMAEAGMVARRDAVGNLIGRYEAARPGATTLVLGSHLDTVRDAGRYDGALGLLIAVEAVGGLHRSGVRLPFAVDVVAFADEEGLRFQTTYLGSRALAGGLEDASLAAIDAEGITVAEAIRAFGGDPARLETARRDPNGLLGYVEVHIEQGPVLEALGLPVGAVTAIAGQTRVAADFAGVAGHAGTVPMDLRHDALCAAAEFVLAVEATARQRFGLVATVGQLVVEPGASNVVPGHVALTVDVRHAEDAERDMACAALKERVAEIAERRGVKMTWRVAQSSPAVACDAILADALADAIATAGYPIHHLPSGAGHDAVALSTITPVAMLFVRCKGGISHHPSESVEVEDVAAALEVLERLLLMRAQDRSPF
ncbi:MAG: allantoate amidohydrolase [Thermomicrobiales bacterium]